MPDVEMVKCKLNGKFNIILPKHRADRPEWYTPQGWEKPRLESIHRNTKKGDVVYYVGAEEGDMCALTAVWGADLVMFEPNPKVSPNIRVIWEANKLPMPIAYFEGFAANVTDLKPEFVEGNPLTIGAFPESAKGEVIGNHGFKELAYEFDVIPQIKIDDMVELTGKVPTMITMDVEGSEFEVLKGAEQTLRNHKPLIYLSLHPEFLWRMFEVYGYDVRHWIMDLGYEEKLLDYQHEVHFAYYPVGTELK